ncbi:MAG: hypothetical protein A2015_00685 [Spirochaetes bacterium GWF1_31_7]|nr:MAG: hypothetical protein A2Y30_12550 [Spirochaetes bacterium GWE1_32_154]OHD48952.1 MAG: hypothetical protein A2Y29_04985 [Spirochaetes bacterium GWE2_31_10]OHD51892.1 MAG: hypothetical protein A2015_00685 [Spirochaetes bacterium GWF1_31_7]OHD75120.1 MAG: hypothetical protein A2355_08555 [Spirochaetes bacterium RIFOXYB1_FULL_32_8]HBD93768.1 XRE family transcriptional regulator [Spirochaetia bacterium]
MEFYEIGETIKKVRLTKKLTQSELAGKANISRQTLAKLEKGSIDKISLQVFVKLLDALEYQLHIEEKKPFYYFDPESIQR